MLQGVQKCTIGRIWVNWYCFWRFTNQLYPLGKVFTLNLIEAFITQKLLEDAKKYMFETKSKIFSMEAYKELFSKSATIEFLT